MYKHDPLDASLFFQLFIGLPWVDGGVCVPLMLTALADSPRRTYVPLSTAIFDAIWCIRAYFGDAVGAFEEQMNLLLGPLMEDLLGFPFETRFFATECALVLQRMLAASHNLYIRLVRYVYALYRFPPRELYDSAEAYHHLSIPVPINNKKAAEAGLVPSLLRRQLLQRKRFHLDHPDARVPEMLTVGLDEIPSSTRVYDVPVFQSVLAHSETNYMLSVSPDLTVADVWRAAHAIEANRELELTAKRMLAPVVKAYQ